MKSPKSHHRLQAWQDSMALVRMVYDLTRLLPKEETYGLVSQLRRAAVSIPSNLAEGAGRDGPREFVRFLSIARGSLSELETQFHGAFSMLEKVSRLVSGLHRKMRKVVSSEQ